jgi:glycerol kinase
MIAAGHGELVRAKTGLVINPYFSASKIAWLLEHVPGLRRRAEQGEILAGTIDSFLLRRLTGGRVHATDATNAARTMLFNLHTQQWDDELLALWGVPRAMLPVVRDSSGDFGETTPELLGRAVPIRGVAGDQQAAIVGQACFTPGMLKSTYGTGAFLLLNTGTEALESRHRLLTTVAYRLNGEVTYALEGSIFNAGTTIQWLRDELGLLPSAAAAEELAREAPESDVYLVPAFTGLGAPYWDSAARAAIVGITRDTGPAQLARAALEAVAYQTRDLLEAMRADGSRVTDLRVDGGMAVNDWLLQTLADQVDLVVRRPVVTETTAFGAACLAGLGLGWFTNLDDLATRWHEQRRFEPRVAAEQRDRRYQGWLEAVGRVRG